MTGQRLARWTPLVWWILARTIGDSLPGPLAYDYTLVGCVGAIVLILVVETWIYARQRSRPAPGLTSGPAGVVPPVSAS